MRNRFRLADADFAITVDSERALSTSERGLGGKGTIAALYGVSLLILALAVFGRIRAAIDPALARRRRGLLEAHAKIAGARGRSRVDGTAQIAGALRTFAGHGAATPGLADMLAECEAVVYAPESADDVLDGAFHKRALDLADRILRSAR